MKHLKTIFACLLMAVLSIGQMWAVDPVLSADFTAKTAGGSSYKSEWTYGNFTIVNAANNNKGWAYMKFGGKSADISTYNPCYVVSPKVTVAISSIDVITNAGNLTKGSVNSWGVYVYSDAEMTDEVDHVTGGTMTAQTAETLTLTPSNSATSWPKDSYYKVYFDLANTTTTNGVVWIDKINWYEYEETPTPSVSVSPASWDFGTVHASAEASKVFSVSGSNLTAGTLSISVPAGFSVSPSSISVTEATLAATNVTVSKNTTAIDDYSGNLSISATCGLTEAKTVALEMSVVADPEPTGTFEPFSGDIEEGDYLIVADGAGMNTTVSGNRLQYTALTLTGENYVDPDESVIWHIAESATAGYWTIYSGAESKYAAATSSNNQAQMLESGTDNKSLWEITHSEAVYTIKNKSNSRFLKKNETYGFGCYSAGTVSLYKKQVAGQPKAPTFSVEGGNYESAQSVELSCETVGATIHYTLDGTKPTSSSPTYSTALNISSTTTVKAVAIKDDIESTVATATYTIIVWQTVADVWDDITVDGPLNAHIYGYVSQTNVGGYDNNFYISDNGSTEGNQLYAYRMNMNSFSVAVGDKVKLAGDLTIHNEVKEFKYTNAENCGKVIALEAKGALQSVAVSGTPIKTEYAANEDFDPTGLKVFGTYANGFVGEITEGITWSNDLTEGKVTESTTVHVTATVSEIASSAVNVPVTVLAATLESITLSYSEVEVYQGKPLPKPVVTAHWSDATTSDVTALASFTGYDKDTPGDQTITVSYQFGTGDPEEATYTVTVKPIYNVELAASVAKDLIETVVGNTESTSDMIVRGKVSYINNASSKVQTYWISDDGTRTNEVEIYKGKYLSGADFTSTNQLRVGDEVVVIGKVINFNNSTPEFANGKSEVQSHVRTPNFTITDVTALEVGATDLAVADLTINVEGEGAVTFASSDNTDAVTIVDGKLHAVAAGTATITANLAADGIYKAATAEFNVTVIPATVKYAITFSGNGATGGDAPEFASEAAAGANVTLPANTYTYTGHSFTGWKVYDENEDEVTVTAGAFTMPASPVTIKAQWAEISVWATTYTSNVTLSYTGTGETNSQVKINDEDYAAQKVGSSGNDGSVVVTVPYGTHTLHFHAVAWNGKSVTIAASGVENMSESSFTLTADPGFKSSGTYTLENDPVGQYFVMTFTAVTEETQITFSKTAGDDKRFMLYGVNQEGGQLPVLESIEIKGDLTTKTGYKAGDALNLDGLTVEATYSIGGVAQTPVDITDKLGDGLTLTYDPLVENQTEVTITATYGDKSDDITITGLDPVASADPKIYVSTLNVNFASVEVGESVPAAETVTVTLTNVASVTATLGGTNADAFSVSPASLTESGDITISILANTDAAASYSATLTISDGEGGADDKTVNLSFEVTEPVVTEEYQLVSDVTSLAAGDQIIIVAENEGDYYTLDGSISSQYFPSTTVSIAAGIITAPSTSAIILGKDGDNWTMSIGGQLIGATAAKKASLGNNDASNTWTIAIAENVATITNTTTTYGSLQFNYNNGSNSRFLNYTSTQTAVAIYKKVAAPAPEYETVRSGLVINRYYTVCLPKKVTAIKGASFWTLHNKSQDGATAYLEEETNNLPFAAGTPFIIQATAENLEVVYEGAATEDAGTNGALHGTLVYMDAAALAAAGSDIYMLFSNELRPVGENNHLDANRAYVKLNELDAVAEAPQSAPGKRVRAMPMQPQVVTDIDAINASEKPMKMMINGQIFILRGEKMYDTTGRLVK